MFNERVGGGRSIRCYGRSTVVLLVLALLGLAVAGWGAFWIERQAEPAKQQIQGPSSEITKDDTTETAPEEIDPSDWLTYRNEEYGFEFRYPAEWRVEKSYSESTNLLLGKAREFHLVSLREPDARPRAALDIFVVSLPRESIPKAIFQLNSSQPETVIGDTERGTQLGTVIRYKSDIGIIRWDWIFDNERGSIVFDAAEGAEFDVVKRVIETLELL